MTRLAHQLLDDERVVISAVGRAMSCHVSMAEARRFAWALLADLDPAEADAMGYQAPAILMLSRAQAEESLRGRGAWQRRSVLSVLFEGRATCAYVAMRVGTSRAQASVQLNRLQHLGYVVKAARMAAGKAFHWEITPAGRLWLDACDAEEERAAAKDERR